MHLIQERLLDLSKRTNLAALTLRAIAAKLGLAGASPQKIKHHLGQLERRGLLTLDRSRKRMEVARSGPGLAEGFTGSTSIFALPILGTANCGPATFFAEENFEGFLRVSSKLVKRSSPAGLYAIRASGASMNRAEINGKGIDDGDLVVIDGKRRAAKNLEVVVAVIDGKATIKQFHHDRRNGQIVLYAASSFDYEPLHLHPGDDFRISGVVVAVVKKPPR
jgi:repressor LexA